MPYAPAEYPGVREYVCDGTHASRNLRCVDSLEVEICRDPCCAKVFARCMCAVPIPESERTPGGPFTRSICEWNEAGTILSCTFCGVDGT